MDTKKILVALVLSAAAVAVIFAVVDHQQNAPEAVAGPTAAPAAPAPEHALPADAAPAPAEEATAPTSPMFTDAALSGEHDMESLKAAAMPPPVAPIAAEGATVNGVQITAEEIQEELDRLLISPNVHGGMAANRRTELRAKALDELVVRELAWQDAKAKKIGATRREIRAALDKVKQQYHSPKSFAEALEAEGITVEDLERKIEREIVLEKYLRTEIVDKARVSESEVRESYEKNKARYKQPESLRLWAIYVEVNPADEAAAKRKIDEAYADLQKGENFGAVAYKFSEDDYRVRGGDYGTIHRGRLSPELESAVFAAKSDEVVAPFRSGNGWSIVLVQNKRPERLVPFEEARDKLTKTMSATRLRERRAEVIDRLRAGAKIEYFEPQHGAPATQPETAEVPIMTGLQSE